MSHIFAVLLWALAATGSHNACESFALSVDADPSACAVSLPPPEETAGEVKRTIDVQPHRRRISNGF
jgi:hypothetical protein